MGFLRVAAQVAAVTGQLNVGGDFLDVNAVTSMLGASFRRPARARLNEASRKSSNCTDTCRAAQYSNSAKPISRRAVEASSPETGTSPGAADSSWLKA